MPFRLTHSLPDPALLASRAAQCGSIVHCVQYSVFGGSCTVFVPHAWVHGLVRHARHAKSCPDEAILQFFHFPSMHATPLLASAPAYEEKVLWPMGGEIVTATQRQWQSWVTGSGRDGSAVGLHSWSRGWSKRRGSAANLLP